MVVEDRPYQFVELRRQKKDGSLIELNASSAALRGADGNLIGLIGIFEDITERKQTEDALRESERRFRAAFENASVGASIVDLKGRFLKVNRLLCGMMGYSEEEMLSKTFSDITHPEDIKIGINAMKSMVSGEKDHVRIEKRYIRKDGHEINAVVSPALIRNEQGEPQYFVGLWQDITERKRAEKALGESEEKYRTLIQTANDAILLVDNETGRIIEANQKAGELFAMPVQEIIGLHHTELHPVELEAQYREGFKKGVPEGGIVLLDMVIARRDGTAVPVEISESLIRLEGREVRLGIFRDVTERKQTEERIKASLQEKEVLLQEIHHRVKNNMQVISSLLKLQAGYVADGETRELLKESRNRIRSMALIHECLYKSKDLARIDFREYVESLTRGLIRSSTSDMQKISLKVDIENVIISADTSIPCGLIINELVSNALKHAFKGGRDGEIRVAINRTDREEYLLTVGDNGVGFPDGLDFMAPDSLGLELVNILVNNQLKGDIELDRTEGTEFRISFKL
jgi:PAS domain S-box-containing protein